MQFCLFVPLVLQTALYMVQFTFQVVKSCLLKFFLGFSAIEQTVYDNYLDLAYNTNFYASTQENFHLQDSYKKYPFEGSRATTVTL